MLINGNEVVHVEVPTTKQRQLLQLVEGLFLKKGLAKIFLFFVYLSYSVFCK
jgi:hypothetical protein